LFLTHHPLRALHWIALSSPNDAIDAADPKCRHWFVPPPKNVNETKTPGAIPLGETVCVLMDGNPDHKHINNSYCMGASAPAWYVLDPLVSHSLVLDEI
jgi:hypothetical protein